MFEVILLFLIVSICQGDASMSDLTCFNVLSGPITGNKSMEIKTGCAYCLEIFRPEEGIKVRWYTCGPTVYDISHMGHARTYIAFDVLRRIFRDYFFFDVVFVLNITDIDDKIIKRARQNFLYEEYCLKENDLADVYNDISKAIRNVNSKSVTEPDPDKCAYLKNEGERLIRLLSSKPPDNDDAVTFLVKNARDAIADVLDQEYGSSVTDHKIFEATARKFEEEYLSDMDDLNVLKPDVLIRVTEYIDPIIKFVQRIIDNGFGYSAPSGSVYFDTNRFANDPKHFYAKLVPTAFGDLNQLATGEGELSSGGEKRSSNDFALWKASKLGEPAWPSPWGPGRPGWHIECSAMASGVLGSSMEIHGGGSDLKFPHHDNELAQSEAYFGHSHWVRYFIHSGHLTISGCKMSKSLKNFITIRDALKLHSARRLRLTFLLHSWRDTMDYSSDTLAEAISFEKTVIDFLYDATSLHLIANQSKNNNIGETKTDRGLMTELVKTQREVYEAFCDSCDTRRAMAALKSFISLADQYALVQISPNMSLMERTSQVYTAASFVLRLLRILGVADLTGASAGTPVPVDGIIAGGKIPMEANPIQPDFDPTKIFENSLQHSWLSLDALTADCMARSLHVGLEAAQSLANVLIQEGETFENIAREVAKDVNFEYGLDLFNIPKVPMECLETALFKATNKKLSQLSSSSEFGLETQVWPIVYALLFRLVGMRQRTRSTVLSVGRATLDSSAKSRLMTACDRMRDEHLAVVGIRLQDRASVAGLATDELGQTPGLGLVDPIILVEELAAKQKREAEKKANKMQQDTAKEEAGRIPPSELFKSQTDKFSAFDSKGMPTHDAGGKALAKSQLKKLQKLYDAQAKRYDSSVKNTSSK